MPFVNGQPPEITVVTPAFREGENLPVLYERLKETLGAMGVTWEWVVVDDHSPDSTFPVLVKLSQQDPRIRGLRLSRNFGSHIALTCGIRHARGNCAVVMAADLQDPPESIPALYAEYQNGAQVVWAVRARREGETASTIGFSRLYYWIMRNLVGMKEMPSTGADFFLITRPVIDAFCEFRETNVSILALITWMGFRQTFVSYVKQARLHGRSGWNLEKKFKLVIDSITAFTYLPIRLMTYAGFLFALTGFVYAGIIAFKALSSRTAPAGYPSVFVAVVVLGGIQMVMLGILGEYLWRALNESRRRPQYLIESITGEVQPAPPASARTSGSSPS